MKKVISRVPVAIGALALVLATGSHAKAGSTPAVNCTVGKEKAACKKTSCLLALDAGVAAKGGSPDPTKVAKCKSSFATAFGKVQTKYSCTESTDPVAVENLIDTYVDDVNQALAQGTPNKCQGAKIKAASKEICCEIGVSAKFAKKTGNDDPTGFDVTNCQAKMTAAFAKLEAKGGCATSSDAAAILAKSTTSSNGCFADLYSDEYPECDSATGE